MKALLASLLLVSIQAHASVFSPVKDSQVPGGEMPKVTQPAVEDAQLFAGRRVAILASHGVEESEIVFPYEYLKARGADVEILVPSWTAQGVVASRFLKPSLFIQASGTFAEGLNRNYDLVILTGGAWNAQVVRTDGDALELVRRQVANARPLAAICAGTSVLINAGVSKGLRMTGSPVVRQDLENSGARFVDEALVVDRNIATSRTPDDLEKFVDGLKQLLQR